ncbi:MAG: glycosyltransferase [Alphaproteobacteria bacterium]|nr:glycosyltransferase [Alphaproteobacteria bacterium]
MNIFFAVNNAYFDKLLVTFVSILENNKSHDLHFFVLTTDISEPNKKKIEKFKLSYHNFDVEYITPSPDLFKDFKINIDYISIETYFRYLIADLKPKMDKCLYLDADLVVNGDLSALYDTDIKDFYAAGVEDAFIKSQKYKENINFKPSDLYVNAGVLLFNLKKIRKDKMVQKLFANTLKLKDKIAYQDQDILNITFKGAVKELDSIYNFTTENAKNERSKRKKAVIIHYTGKRKPWDKNCHHKLASLWHVYDKLTQTALNKKIKVGLLIDEFFGGAGTAFGGYGFLARKYIAKYIPDDDIQVDVLLGKSKYKFWGQKWHVDDVDLYRLPRQKYLAERFLKKKNYDVYLSIELTSDFVLKHETDPNKRLILWIQDPRPKYEWEEIETVKLFKEFNYYDQRIYDFVHNLNKQKRIKFISQGHFLNQKAIDLYHLPAKTPIQYMPNPVEIDKDFDPKTYPKKNNIIFLGRIESVKRGWLFCEIAKRLPEYDFYMLGQTFREKSKNSEIMKKYQNISNLHFAGHVDGKEKKQFLKEAKILINTSIHEALPISFLEALSYGVVLVSNRNPEDLTSKFGIWTGQINGDGFDKVDLYVDAIKKLMKNEKMRQKLSKAGRTYVQKIHNIERFTNDLREVVLKEILI